MGATQAALIERGQQLATQEHTLTAAVGERDRLQQALAETENQLAATGQALEARTAEMQRQQGAMAGAQETEQRLSNRILELQAYVWRNPALAAPPGR